jgi:FixJ family two-component response regulator
MQGKIPLGADATGLPTCMIVEDDSAVMRTLQLILGGRCLGPSAFAAVGDVVEACEALAPDILFLDLALPSFDAIDVIRALGHRGYRGAILLASGLHALLHQVTRVGERHGLVMLPPLAKPFRAQQIEQILRDFAARPPKPAAAA